MQRSITATSLQDVETEQAPLFTFRLSDQIFALPIEPIAQIIEMVSIIPLVKASSLLEGVIRVRGKIIPVIDLRRFLNFTATPFGLHTPIILANIKNQMVGLIADEALDVVHIPMEQIAKPQEFLPTEMDSSPFLTGVVQTEGGHALLLNLNHLFEPDQERAINRAVKEMDQTASIVSLKPRNLPAAKPQEQRGGNGTASDTLTGNGEKPAKSKSKRKAASADTHKDQQAGSPDGNGKSPETHG